MGKSSEDNDGNFDEPARETKMQRLRPAKPMAVGLAGFFAAPFGGVSGG